MVFILFSISIYRKCFHLNVNILWSERSSGLKCSAELLLCQKTFCVFNKCSPMDLFVTFLGVSQGDQNFFVKCHWSHKVFLVLAWAKHPFLTRLLKWAKQTLNWPNKLCIPVRALSRWEELSALTAVLTPNFLWSNPDLRPSCSNTSCWSPCLLGQHQKLIYTWGAESRRFGYVKLILAAWL